jgi:hypothetical protein
LIDLLARFDPAQPVYLGTALGHWDGHHYYMEGAMYGFTVNVMRTISAADVEKQHVQWGGDEDARIGSLMVRRLAASSP